MPSFANAISPWFRRTFAWSNSRQSWRERVSIAFVLAAALGIGLLHGRLSLPQEGLLWSLLALVTAILLRRGWIRLCGPLLFYELVRIARRRRHFVTRSLFPIPIAVVICWMYFWSTQDRGSSLRRNDMADLSMSFFYAFCMIQFFLVMLLTPAFTAGAITEEKDCKTLEFLLATDLRNREIVLSKLFARLANLALFVMTGLPILSLIQFLGGVDPNLLLASFAATGLTMASLAGYGILNSVFSRRSRDAMAATYLGAAAYLILSSASWALLDPGLGLATFPSTNTWRSPVDLEEAVHAINVGNPFSAVNELFDAIGRGKHIDDVLPGIFGPYALFHGLIAICCSMVALLRLRAIAEKHAYAKARKIPWRLRLLVRPRIGPRPMLWKEIFAEPGIRLNLFAKIVVFLLVVGSFIPVGILLVKFFDATQSNFGWTQMGRNVNEWIRLVGTIVACLLLLAVAVRASSSISGERDRQTFDALLASPLETSAILFAKWIGSVVSVRWGWLWLGLMYGLGLLTEGLDFLALNLLILAWLIYAGVVASFGVWFSLVCRTTLRSTVWTLIATVSAGVGHWLLWIFLYPLSSALSVDWDFLKVVVNVEIGVTPPATLGYAFPFANENNMQNDFGEPMGYALLGLVCWVLVTAAVWRATNVQFDAITGRQRPLQAPPSPPRPAPLAHMEPTRAS
jgi:ABC-type Na+ efflux pump permease subunit